MTENSFSSKQQDIFTKRFFLFLIGYFILQIIIRILVSDTLYRDEAEQLIFCQQWRLSYTAQPPLYTWLQKIFFAIFGMNIFALALLKNSLLSLTYIFVYKTACLILKDKIKAIIAAMALFLFYQFSWECQRDLTHTVILCAVTAVSFYYFIKLLYQPKARYYLILGLLFAGGILSKYNYIYFIVALLVSSLTIKELRAKLFNRKIILTFIVLFVLIAPHLFYILTHKAYYSDNLSSRFGVSKQLIYGIELKGFWLFLYRALLLCLPQIILCLFFPLKTTKKDRNSKEFVFLLERFFIFGFIIIGLSLIIFKATDFHSKWLLPFILFLPLYLLLKVDNRYLSQLRVKLFAFFILLGAVMVTIYIPSYVVFAGVKNKYKYLNCPYNELATMIKKDGFNKGIILIEELFIGGNLKLYFPDSFVAFSEIKRLDAPKDYQQILVVWEDRHGNKDWFNKVTPQFQELIKQYLGNNIPDGVTKQALYKYTNLKYPKDYRINTLIMPGNKPKR